jgi:hypothetical protein
MNLRELDSLIARLQENADSNIDLILFYKRKRVELIHRLCDELISILKDDCDYSKQISVN